MEKMNKRNCITFFEALKEAERILNQASIPDYGLDAWYLMEYVFGIERTYYLTHREESVPESRYSNYMRLVQQRAEHIPLQYITGVQEFMGLEFCVNENVLIPRQDTEILVEEVQKDAQNKKVLDLCTGSGCIIISLGKLCKLKKAVGVDISEDALSVARENSIRNEVEVFFQRSDLFQRVKGKYDIIVSNPPYIETAVIETLMPEVRLHEPHLALDGKEDGLFFYKRIINQAEQYLEKDGKLFFEIGNDQGDSVAILLKSAGFCNIKVTRDLAGRDRVVSASCK